MQLTHLSLFTGIGGLDLAAEWAGFRTVGQCEWADYPTRVLEKHWPDVPRWRDVRGVQVTAKCGKEITVLSGGFPCQPHSLAGKRLASGDERDLWGELARVIYEVKPRWVVAENVPGLLSSEHGRFFGRVLRDLAGMGYDAAWGVLSAFQAGLPHERKRVCIVANATRFGCNGVSIPKGIDNQKDFWEVQSGTLDIFNRALWVLQNGNDRSVRKDNGVSREVDELRALGNAVAPPQFYPIFKTIAEIESQQWGGCDKRDVTEASKCE